MTWLYYTVSSYKNNIVGPCRVMGHLNRWKVKEVFRLINLNKKATLKLLSINTENTSHTHTHTRAGSSRNQVHIWRKSNGKFLLVQDRAIQNSAISAHNRIVVVNGTSSLMDAVFHAVFIERSFNSFDVNSFFWAFSHSLPSCAFDFFRRFYSNVNQLSTNWNTEM